MNQQATRDLGPGEQIEDSLTLFGGAQGALFPVPGTYRVVVDVSWRGKGEDISSRMDFVASGEAAVSVTAATEDAHRDAA